jgi:hypothetical protein
MKFAIQKNQSSIYDLYITLEKFFKNVFLDHFFEKSLYIKLNNRSHIRLWK